MSMPGTPLTALPVLFVAAALLAGCAAEPGSGLSVPEETRPQDARRFTVDEALLPFAALPGAGTETDRWWGVLNGAGYRIEVPKDWNGMLVMYAHGYAGTGPSLILTNPAIRRHLIENGYAWAASTYSRNYYDVRAGIEDTNALALAFTRIAAANKRPLQEPKKRYIVGQSMGGHVAAAAVERETLAHAVHKLAYDGAMPVCGVVGDTELFDYFAAYQMAAMYFAGTPASSYPVANFAARRDQIVRALWTSYPAATTAQGDKLKTVVMNLTGGRRPIFDEGFKVKPLQDAIWSTFAQDGTVDGILNKSVVDTSLIVYQLDDDRALSNEEVTLNRSILRAGPDHDANRLRSDGLRWVPKVHGRFDVPVVTLHTLGDLYVPFRMEQVYRRRAIAQGSDKWLVQRAIRSPGHCDFSVAEQVAAFKAMTEWEQHGRKPAGDDVLTPAVVAQPSYGCRFTINTAGRDDLPYLASARGNLPACPTR